MKESKSTISRYSSIDTALKVMLVSGIDPSIRYSLEKGKVFKTINRVSRGRGCFVDFPSAEDQVVISLLDKLGCFVYHVLYSEYEEGAVVFGATSFLIIPTAEHFPHLDKYDLEYEELVTAAECGVTYAFTINEDCGCGRCGYSAFEEINVNWVNGRLVKIR